MNPKKVILALMGLVTRALVGAILLVLMASAGPAQAAVKPKMPPKPAPRPVITNAMLVSSLPTDYEFRTIAWFESQALVAGAQYQVSGGWSATAEVGALMGARVEMVPKGSTDLSQRMRSALTTRNHEGEDWGLAPGTVRAVAAEGLFTVPVPEGKQPGDLVDYKIELRGQAGKCAIASGVCVVQPQYSLQLTGATLTFDPTPYAGGLEWRQPADAHFGGPAPRPAAVDVLVKAHELPVGTTSVRAYTGAEVSVESTGGTAPLRAKLTQQVRQLNATGGYCKTTSTSTVVDIDGRLHHLKVHQYQTVPVDPSCGVGPGGGPRFSTKVYVQYVAAPAGDPVRHGGVVHAEPYSSGYILPA